MAGLFLCVDQLHQLAFDRRQHWPKIMPALEYRAALTDQGPHALTVAQGGALFDAIFGPLGGAPEHAEHGGIAAQIDGIIAPVSRRDHPAVQVQYLRQLIFFKADLIMAADPGKGRYDCAQLTLRPLAGLGLAGVTLEVASRSAINSATFFRNASISHCMISRLCVVGSNISRHGVP